MGARFDMCNRYVLRDRRYVHTVSGALMKFGTGAFLRAAWVRGFLSQRNNVHLGGGGGGGGGAGEDGTAPGVLYTQAVNYRPGALSTLAVVGDKLLFKAAGCCLAVVLSAELLTELGVMQSDGSGTFACANSGAVAPRALTTAAGSAMQARRRRLTGGGGARGNVM